MRRGEALVLTVRYHWDDGTSGEGDLEFGPESVVLRPRGGGAPVPLGGTRAGATFLDPGAPSEPRGHVVRLGPPQRAPLELRFGTGRDAATLVAALDRFAVVPRPEAVGPEPGEGAEEYLRRLVPLAVVHLRPRAWRTAMAPYQLAVPRTGESLGRIVSLPAGFLVMAALGYGANGLWDLTIPASRPAAAGVCLLGYRLVRVAAVERRIRRSRRGLTSDAWALPLIDAYGQPVLVLCIDGANEARPLTLRVQTPLPDAVLAGPWPARLVLRGEPVAGGWVVAHPTVDPSAAIRPRGALAELTSDQVRLLAPTPA